MNYIGIDMGSTAAKVVIMDADKKSILEKKIIPSGWNSKETSSIIKDWFESSGYRKDNSKITATGYGRICVPYADKVITEISCHAKGAAFMADKDDLCVIDIGGQDTKLIYVENGFVSDFIMNDKCSAGTGKFLEIMANRLGTDLDEILFLASKGTPVQLSTMCTVFAESEVISLSARGVSKSDIACSVVNSIISKVALLARKRDIKEAYFVTGGFCEASYVMEGLQKELKSRVFSCKEARYAGALGACLLS